MQQVEFRLQGDRLIHATAARPLTAQDRDRFIAWANTYHALAWQKHNDPGLLALGREIHAWLDGDERWLAALREQGDAPVVAGFAVSGTPTEQDRQFLEVPWELAADGDIWLAADPGMMWAPLRRIGAVADPPPPNPTHRLGVLFMAAAPHGQPGLDIEAEEVAILRATADLGIDLQVEDTGTLAELTQSWQAARDLNVLHLSCHGMGGATPFLALEDAVGDLARVTLDDLAGSFTEGRPQLLFLSACHTGQGGEAVDSLTRALVRVGFPAVLGWADSVFDRDASAFAAAFYRRAAQPNRSIQAAWAGARYDLLRQPHPPTHWHLARLFLGRSGGGALAAGTRARGRTDPDAGRKGVLEAPGRQIEVASRFEFVGRRRQSQAIERAFRGRTHAGAAILGLGRQGKSSLAARIIDRHPHLTPVVLFRACDGPTLLAEFCRKIGGAAEACAGFRDRVDPHQAERYDPNALYHALHALLEGPCGHRSAGGKPVLLLLDDFEALLDPPSGPRDLARVQPDPAATLAAIIRAFTDADTESRLLLTSRYAFRLPEHGHDLAERLLPVELPAMSPADSRKQARQKLAASGQAAADPSWFAGFQPRAIRAAHGNAGLQDLLFQAALAEREAGEAATAALEAHLTDGAMPEQQDLRDTLEGLAIGRLLGWLTRGEQRLLRASTLFRLPVPLPVWRFYAAEAGLGAPDRLFAFGLWERLPDLADPHADAAAPNAIATSRLPGTGDAAAGLAVQQAVLPALFRAWGGTDRTRTPYAADIELTRVALDCGNLDVLAATAENAIRGQEQAFAYRAAAVTATAALAALTSGDRPRDAGLLRAAAEVFDRVGDAAALQRVYAAAPSLATDDPALPEGERIARAQFRLRFAGWLEQQGEPDRALAELRAAQPVFEALGDRRSRAVTLGDIARIMTDKGEVDAALELHNEQVRIFEALGDRRSRAVTLGDIARIMTDKGEVDAALELHNEQVQIFEALGDRRERAVTLGDIARIMTDKGEVDAALELHNEELKTYEALGDRRSRAVTLGDIARIMTAKGEVDAALELHNEKLRIVEALGDRRSRAVTLGDIARIMTAKGEVDAALELHNEQVRIFEALGDRRERAVTLGDIARIMTDKGEVDAALELHNEKLRIVEALGDRRERAVTLGDIARIMRNKGEVDAALELHNENLRLCEELGDQKGRAVTLGEIARIMTAKGEVDAALELHNEALQTYEALGDRDGIANANYDIGRIYLSQAAERRDAQAFQQACAALAESYRILLEIGRLDGICVVGMVLGQALAMGGQGDEAKTVIARSRDGFHKLGQARLAVQAEELLRQLG